MSDELERILESMADAGCGAEEKEHAKLLYMSGDMQGLIRFLRRCRCGLMEELHKSQRKVDCLDILIRRTSKAIQ